MPPRLNHQKSVYGCLRCKKRRVKCDEVKPSCGACHRHRVPCEYLNTQPNNGLPQGPRHGSVSGDRRVSQHDPGLLSPISATSRGTVFGTSPDGAPTDLAPLVDPEKNALEMRLMHYWLMYTCTSFSTAEETWKHRIPLLAYSHRPVFDGLLALAAGHLFRESLEADDKMELSVPGNSNPSYKKIIVDHRAFLSGKSPREMRNISCDYFQSCIKGHRHALSDLATRDYEVAYIASVIISFYSLFMLGEDDDEYGPDGADEMLWFSLAVGPRQIVAEWGVACPAVDVLRKWGQFDQDPDMSDQADLFDPAHAEPWSGLLVFAAEYEITSPLEQQAYQQTLSYIGLIHKAIVQRSESPTAICRRIAALPARVPVPFADMVLRQQPRALVILAHLFAMMKAIEGDIIWFKGTPEKQIKLIYAKLPAGWKKAMQWPLKVMVGRFGGDQMFPPPLGLEEIAGGGD